jgi:hypothetical protein
VLEETSYERCILCGKSNRLEETVLKENKINQIYISLADNLRGVHNLICIILQGTLG